MSEDAENAPGFYRLELATEGAERLVLRFQDADISAIPAEGSELTVEFELRGPQGAIAGWKPSIRRIEGILVLGEDPSAVRISELRARLPVALRDLEIHGRSGDVDVNELSIGIVAETHSGRIKVKGGASLEAKTYDGAIELEATGLSQLHSHSGPIKAVEPEGRLTATTESGDIEVDDSAADLYLQSETGEIAVNRPRGRVRAVSLQGDVEIDAPEPFGGGEANTTSGHIGLILGGASLELRAETLSGRLKTPSGEVGNSAGPRRVATTISGGGRRLHAKSVSGDIDIDY